MRVLEVTLTTDADPIEDYLIDIFDELNLGDISQGEDYVTTMLCITANLLRCHYERDNLYMIIDKELFDELKKEFYWIDYEYISNIMNALVVMNYVEVEDGDLYRLTNACPIGYKKLKVWWI